MKTFIDRAKIHVIAGTGGNGSRSFRREKFIPKGGPDGGDGGDGGSVFFYANPQINTLVDFRYKRIYKASDGEKGLGAQCFGKKGNDIIIHIPCGTLIYDENNGELIHDFVTPEEMFLIAKGGDGGYGNVHYKSSVNQAPTYAQKGFPGEEKVLILELKLIADIGLIGMPNAGKSTVLSRFTKAKPKIADYPFTTLSPNLGVLEYDDKRVVIADIPGLIEGAAEGKGLGDDFLRHIERTKFFLHIIDISGFSGEPKENYKIIRSELKKYSPELIKRPEIIVLNKIDAIDKQKLYEIQALFKNKKIHSISAVTGEGINPLQEELLKQFFSKEV